ncbi:transposase [Komagataeibacter medellinensis NBRC 3288]|uniref:Transposase n=1 Tax=Komagataeibacter medellinensis (strain NBRC 3288 / BCRC 11682 / LMG 1693 / Kondo 51) TaxID=634177 RepID=G2I737_KOMMN|nr:transposase [Komagataeibacter medellinensis NBRC 3288]
MRTDCFPNAGSSGRHIATSGCVSWRRTCIWITTRLPLFGGRTGQPLKRHLRRSCFWRETGLLRPGVVLIDGTKIDADASKYRSLRYDRIRALREQLAADISRN